VRGMSSSDTTRCATCQQPATVRVRGVSLCAACALVAVSRPADGDDERAASRLARRLRRLGALSGMLTAKIVLGAVALAAVGSVAVASVGAGSTTTTTAPPTTSTQGQDEYRQAVRDWADCVSVAAAAADTDFDRRSVRSFGRLDRRAAEPGRDRARARRDDPRPGGDHPGRRRRTTRTGRGYPRPGGDHPGSIGHQPGQVRRRSRAQQGRRLRPDPG
jgi:hypothetical protein